MKILQIGTNNGNDHVFKFCLEHKEEINQIVLIDANESCEKTILKCYKDFKNVEFFNLAITPADVDCEISLYVPAVDDMSNFVSLSKGHVTTHLGNQPHDLVVKKVAAVSLNTLLEEKGLKILDWLFMDLEGLDASVILSIDFSKVEIKNIVFEKTHTDGPFCCGKKYQEVCNYLTARGYSLEENKFGDANNVLAKR